MREKEKKVTMFVTRAMYALPSEHGQRQADLREEAKAFPDLHRSVDERDGRICR